jgi:putative ABC transport system permease protein
MLGVAMIWKFRSITIWQKSIIGKGGMLQRVTGVILGSCLYRFIVAVALRLNVPAECLKLVSAIIVAVAIAFPYLKKQMNFYRQKRAAKAQNQIYVQEIMKNDSEGGER